MMTFFTESIPHLAFEAIYVIALDWSSRVKAEKFSIGIEGANFDAIRAFVLAGFPTTQTLTDFLANLSRADP
jgi:hypothetical protein